MRTASADADFGALRERALEIVRKTQGGISPEWSDHNLHDPGVTLLEACLFALADLHYRIAERSFDQWAVERPPPAAGHDPERAPLLRQALLERSGPIERLLATAPSAAAAHELAARLLEDLDLGFDEVESLIAAVRGRRLVRVLGARAAELREAVKGAGDAGEALAALHGAIRDPRGEEPLGLGEEEARLALGLVPNPPVPPEFWEGEEGATRLWPPHRKQALGCEPVTLEDYRQRALAVPAVRRAWVVRGLAPGVDWDGTKRWLPRPHRRGALTLLVDAEPAAGESQRKFLAGLLEAVLRDLGEGEERRLLGDEVGAALLSRYGVVVRGRIEVEPTASEDFVIERATQLLADFLVPPAPPPAGWEPGRPVRASELVELVQGIPGVVGVEGLRLQRSGEPASEWHDELSAPPGWEPYQVPYLDRHCLRPRILEHRECRGA